MYPRTWALAKGKSPWILKCDIFLLNLAKKGCFIGFEWVKSNFDTFGPPGKPFWLPLENPLFSPTGS